MSLIETILLAIRSLAVVASNPALGGGSSLRNQEISEFLNMLGALIATGKAGHDDLKEFTAVVSAMAEENRGPTPAEFASLRARSNSAHDRLQAAKAKAIADESGEEDELMEELRDDLVEMAEDLEIDVPSSATKSEIVALIRQKQREAPQE